MGSGDGLGRGSGGAQGGDVGDERFGAGATGVLLILLWIVGIPLLVAGIGMVTTTQGRYISYYLNLPQQAGPQ